MKVSTLSYMFCMFQNTNKTSIDWQTAVDPAALLERYSDFHPSIVAVLR
jgi:hypothetical protein